MSIVAEPTFTSVTNRIAGFSNRPGVAAHTDGTLIAAYKDGGASTSNIKVVTSSDQGETWVQRASINTPAACDSIAVGIHPDGSLAIVARSASRIIMWYCKVTYSTWAASAWEVAYATIESADIGEFDIDVSSGGIPGICLQVQAGSGSLLLRLFTRNSSGNWVTSHDKTLYSAGSRRKPGECVSIVALNNLGGVRQWVAVAGYGNSNSDEGMRTFSMRVTESTGAGVGEADGIAAQYVATIKESTTSGRRREVQLFPTGTNEYTLLSCNIDNSVWGGYTHLQVLTATVVSGTRTVTRVESLVIPPAISNGIVGIFGFSLDADKNAIFRYTVPGKTTSSPRIVSDVILADGTKYTGAQFTYLSGTSSDSVDALSHGTKRNFSVTDHPFLYQYRIASDATNKHVIASDAEGIPDPGGASAIVTLIPANGVAEQVANPILNAYVHTGDEFSQSAYVIEFEFASDNTFDTNKVTHKIPNTEAKVVNGTNVENSTVLFTSKLPDAYNLSKRSWYYRARLVDIFGNVGLWSPIQSFTVGHPPTGLPISPSGSQYYIFSPVRNFSWEFYDPSPTDYQTAYQLEIVTLEDASYSFVSEKVISSNKYVDLSIGVGGPPKDNLLGWRVKLWDSDDTPGDWSIQQQFFLTDPTVITVESPTQGQVLPTGVPTITFTPTTGGSRPIKEYTVVITQGPDIVWSRRVHTPGLASGVQQSVKVEQGFLVNNSPYSVQVSITDSAGLQSQSSVVSFFTAWINPASPTGLEVFDAQYNIEDEGYIAITWDDLARDDDFTFWSLYRKSDLVDNTTGQVLEEGSFELLDREYSISSDYEYRDYFAPANYLVTYRLVQSVNRLGQDIDSAPTDHAGIIPFSDGYWLIEPSSLDASADAFKLSIVTADSFTDEQEESEFNVIGRGRVVNKGQKLGNKGTLEVQLRNTGGTTARQKRLRLKELQEGARQLYLRNPFGDIFRVSVSMISISRVAGVGRSEFCDVTIPYSEVS